MHPGIFNGPESTQVSSDAYSVERPVSRMHREHFRVLRLYLAYASLELEQYFGSD